MKTEDNGAPPRILQLLRNTGFKSEAAQIQAKSLLREVTAETPEYNWRYIAQRMIRNSVLGTLTLQNIARRSPQRIGDWSDVARRLGLVWEALGQLREGTKKETALLNAAVNYELAGYQANAAYLARQLDKATDEHSRHPLSEMGRLFLQRRLLRLRRVSEDAQVEPNVDDELGDQYVESLATALVGSAFSDVTRFLLSGDRPALERAAQTFEAAQEFYSSLYLIDEANLVNSIRSILPVIDRRSTWTLLWDAAEQRPKWLRYLKLLARGIGTDLLKSSSISELWPSQIAALEQGLLSSPSSKVVKMPTSAGKTRIAELAIMHTLVNEPGAKCVYVAPYRALVSELQHTFLNLLSDLGYRSSAVTGSYESDEFEESLLRHTDVLVTTPEKLDLVLRTEPELLEDARLFVLDEAQIVREDQRGVKFELLLTRLKNKLPSARFLVLSAVLPQQTLEDFARWFNASPQTDVLTSLWRPSIQRYAKLEWRGQTGVLRYAPDPDEEVQVLQEFVPGVIRQQTFEHVNPETGYRRRPRFPDSKVKAQIAAEHAFKFAELGPVLIFCSQPDFVKSVANALQKRLELMRLTNQNLPSYFERTEDTRSVLLAEEWLGDRSIASMLRSGIGVHYGSLPDAVRSAVETDFRQRKLRVLVATSTLAQGVNLPVRTAIVHSCVRFVDNARQRIPAIEYWNAAGRAGRAGEETEGLIIHITNSPNDERDFRYYLGRRQNVEPVESALLQRLVDLVQDRLSEDALKAELDPEILALLIEEDSTDLLESSIQRLLDGALVDIQARRDHRIQQSDRLRLHEVFVDVGKDILDRVPELERRRVYSSTGLSTYSCQVIHDHIVSNGEFVKDFLLSGNLSLLNEMVDLVLPVALELPEMQSNREVAASYTDLLQRWMEGIPVKDILREFNEDSSSPEELGRFIDELFGYRLPWAISGYIRIAKDLLEIETSAMSEYAKFFPSMVKYGIPDVESCWAMSAGIPFRRVAIAVAAAYRAEAEEKGYENFLEWLNDLNSERLHQEFGLTSPVLEDVSRAIFTSATNRILRDFESLDELFPRVVDLRRIAYNNRSLAALSANVGSEIELVRDYDDSIDRNAVMALLSGRKIGYLPRRTAQILAPEMDTGTSFNAIVHEVERATIPRVSVQLTQRMSSEPAT